MMFRKILKFLLIIMLYNNTESFHILKNNNLRLYSRPSICKINACSNINDPWDYSRFIRINPTPIPVISFDDLFMNLKNINTAILTTNCDRLIILYNGGKQRGVYYMDPNNQQILSKVRFLLSQIQTDIRLEYPKGMDNPRHKWFCEPNPNNGENNLSDINILENIEDDDENFEDYDYDFGFD